MKKNILVDQSTTQDGKTVSLYTHDGDYSIRIDGLELMSTRQNNSEKVLAEVVCKKYAGRDIRVLVGGLGFGFTLEAVLENVSDKSVIITAELLPCVIKWNRDSKLPLAHKQVSDKRVTVVQQDVGDLLRKSTKKFDAIILDVDNGPEALSADSNVSLYNKSGLHIIKSSLKVGGTLGIWSADSNQKFEKLMNRVGFKTETVTAHARANKGGKHTLFIGTV